MVSDNTMGENLVDLIDKETEVLNRYCVLEKELFAAITARNWTTLEETTGKLEKTALVIREIDHAREELVAAMQQRFGIKDREGFYRFLQRLPERERGPLAASFRDMKIAVFRLQALNNQIQGYVRTKTGTLREIMEELFPHQKGTMYCKRGKTAEPETNPMFVSHHL